MTGQRGRYTAPSLKGDIMPLVCEHMNERTIEYPEMLRTHIEGDKIRLICPHGCEDIVIRVVDNEFDNPVEELLS